MTTGIERRTTSSSSAGTACAQPASAVTDLHKVISSAILAGFLLCISGCSETTLTRAELAKLESAGGEALQQIRAQDLVAALHCEGILASLNAGEIDAAKDQARMVLAEFQSGLPPAPNELEGKLLEKIQHLALHDAELRALLRR